MEGRGREGREQTGITRMRLGRLYAYQDINISSNAFFLLYSILYSGDSGNGLALKMYRVRSGMDLLQNLLVCQVFSTENKYQISYGAF